MKFHPANLILVATLAVACGGCSPKAKTASNDQPLAPGERRYALTGEVLKGDPDAGTLYVRHEAIEGLMGPMAMVFHAHKGDIAIFTPGRRIRADLIVNAQSEFRLENVWPDDRTEADILAAAAKTLREDTLIKGKSAYREVGEKIPDFTLYDQNGKVVDSGKFRGKQVMLNFIYTRCPDPNMCPLATANMVKTQHLAREAGISDIEFISITLDPAFDTPGILRAYADSHGIDTSNYSLLTGPIETERDLLVQFGLAAEFKGNLLNHTLRTMLIDRDGKIRFSTDGSQWDPADYVERMSR